MKQEEKEKKKTTILCPETNRATVHSFPRRAESPVHQGREKKKEKKEQKNTSLTMNQPGSLLIEVQEKSERWVVLVQ